MKSVGELIFLVNFMHRGMTVKIKITERILLFSVIITTTTCYGPHHPRGPRRHVKHEPESNSMKDPRFIDDEEHIRKDLNYLIKETKNTSIMRPEELELHYFKSHDYDNNTKLDGLEILEGIRHSLHDEGGMRNEEEFEYYIGLIDSIFREDDVDQDGYLSYVEYVSGRETAKTV